MIPAQLTLDEVLTLARRLPPSDQARLVVRLAPAIEQVLDRTDASSSELLHTPLRGLLADLGPAPSESDISEIQREMWSTFSNEQP